MADATVPNWFAFAFPFLFVGMWLVITTMLGFMSGWFNLQQWYADDGSEEPLLTLRRQSGPMGAGVALNGILTLSAKRSGLSIRIWRIFAPFQKPLLVPWSEISAEASRTFFVPMVKLSLGNPANGKLKIGARSWSRLRAAVPQTGGGRLQFPAAPAISQTSVVRGMFFEWLIITSVVATFFYLATHAKGLPGLPLGVCIALPAVAVGIGQLVRYGRLG